MSLSETSTHPSGILAIMRTAAALMVAVLVAGCAEGGFRPMYGTIGVAEGADLETRLAQVELAPVPGRVGQRVRNELIFQTTGGDLPLPPLYRLEIVLRESVTSTLVQRDGDSLSQIYQLDADFRLVSLTDKRIVLNGSSFGRAGFERYTSVYSNVRAREDAENRAAKTVAGDIKGRVAAFLARPA